MALGKTDITNLKDKIAEIKSLNNDTVMDCWNTFQYIAKNLDNWADETTIGSDLRADMSKITEAVRDNANQTNSWISKLETFVEEQEVLNKG